jgi:hypothetical protein
MKYLFLTSLFILTLCTCVSAQTFSIELKPGGSDSAQWVVEYDLNGTPQIAREPFDTMPNVLAFGYTLFREGGAIGTYVVEGPEPMRQRHLAAYTYDLENNDRGKINYTIATSEGGFGPSFSDDSYNDEMIGLWDVSLASCDFGVDTIAIAASSFLPGIEFRIPGTSQESAILTFGDGVMISAGFTILNEGFVMVRKETGVWLMANGCTITKVPD